MDDFQASVELKRIACDYLLGLDPDIQALLLVIESKDRHSPIKEVLHRIEKYRKKPFAENDLKIVKELLYMYW